MKVLLFCLLSFAVVAAAERVLGRDESVPKGSHVRINLETGERHLISTPDNNNNQVNVNGQASSIIAVSQPHDASIPLTNGPLKVPLKEKLNLDEIVASLDSLVQEIDIIHALDSLDDIVSQHAIGVKFVESAAFVQMAGWLKHSSAVVRRKSLRVIGSALQNNSRAQEAVKGDLCGELLGLLRVEKDKDVVFRALFALGSLLRGNVKVIDEFYEKRGVDVFVELDRHDDYKISNRCNQILTDTDSGTNQSRGNEEL